MHGNSSEELYHIAEIIRQFIIQNDIFWIMDLRTHLGIGELVIDNTKDPLYSTYTRMNRVIKLLCDSGYLQCCENRKQKRQYIMLITIPTDFVEAVAYKAYNRKVCYKS